MANSRLERLGTIYSRVTGLLRAGAMKEDDKPLWYEIYKAFPPEKEPTIAHLPPNIEIKPIFYAEDTIRAKFHKKGQNVGIVNLSDSVTSTPCQQFISAFNKLKTERKEDDDVLFEEAFDILKNQLVKKTNFEHQKSTVPTQKLSIVELYNEVKKE